MQPASDGIVTPREGRAGGRGRSWAADRACIAAFSPDSAHSWHFTSTDNTSCPPLLSQVCPGCFTPPEPLLRGPGDVAKHKPHPHVCTWTSGATSSTRTVLHHIKGAAWGAGWSRTPQSLPHCQPGATELSVPPVPRNPKVPVPTSLTQQDIPQEQFLKSNRL